MYALIQDIIKHPGASLLIIGNLVLIESLLSVDNAAVLATMVMGLSPNDRKRALKYGIFGAYIFRGLCLFFASFLVKVWWLKVVGGLYLLYLAMEWIIEKTKKKEAAEPANKAPGRLYAMTVGRFGIFWATVISVEIMDLAFSMDNVFAAVAFSNNILIILCGVFIGILAMRFVAQGFVQLMQRYPFLEGCAYAVIGLLGIKLSLSLYQHYYPAAKFSVLLSGDRVDSIVSVITISIFLVPIITSLLFNVPGRKVK